jgi:hypothetical protein
LRAIEQQSCPIVLGRPLCLRCPRSTAWHRIPRAEVRARGAGSAVGRALHPRRDAMVHRSPEVPDPPMERPTIARVEAGCRARGDMTPTARRLRLVPAWWCDAGGCPHPHTSTLAAELRPSSRKGLTAVAMRPRTQSPVCGRGLPTPPPQVELYQPSPILPMPVCSNCLHRGEDHNWRVPACSLCGGRGAGACRQCERNHELRRVRGACLASSRERRCFCSKYVPLNERGSSAGRRFSLKRR